MDNNCSYSDIITKICREKFYIYGKGKIGKRFYYLLQRKELLDNFRGFVVTTKQTDDNYFENTEVYPIGDIDKCSCIFVAVDYTLYCEIEKHLIDLGYDNYYWIYPYLFDLYFGQPIVCNERVAISYLLKNNEMANWIAICYLALADYFVGKDDGKNIYIKVRRLSYSQATSENDFLRFVKEGENYYKNGYKQQYSVKLSKDKKLTLDGAHRIAFAVYFNERFIVADLYDCEGDGFENFSKIGGGNGNITRTDNLKYILNEDEVVKVNRTLKEIISYAT